MLLFVRKRTFAPRCFSVDMDAGLLYQNALIKSREGMLLSADRLQRIADADTLDDAVRLLAEAGYPSGETYEDILFAAEREASLFFKSCLTKGYGLELFLTADDFHNAKVAAKAFFFGGSKEAYKPEGQLTYAVIESALESGETKALPTAMAEAFAALKKLSSRDALYPSSVDVLLDKAAYQTVQSSLNKADKVIQKYFALLADLKNVSVAYRAGKASLSREKTQDMLLPAGTLGVKDLMKVYEFGEDAADKVRADSVLQEALLRIKEGTAAYEKYMEDALITLLKKQRYNMFSPAPIAGFYIGKLREIKNVRLILARIANGVDKEIIKKRMRELYV